MKTIDIKGQEIKIYDSIDEMPIGNYQRLNKYLLIDAGIGADADSIEAHIVKIANLIKIDSKEKALQELQNMRMNLYSAANQISYKNMAFASLIYSIGGKPVTDYSEENLKRIIDSFSEVKQTALFKLLERIKKKIDNELVTYFPSKFTSAMEKEAYSKFKLRTILMLESIAEDTDNSEQIKGLDSFFISLQKPRAFTGKYSAEVQYDKQYEGLCLAIAQRTSLNAKDMTVLQFYNTVTVLEEQIKSEQQSYKHH